MLVGPKFNDSIAKPFRDVLVSEIGGLIGMKKGAYEGYLKLQKELSNSLGEEHFMNALPLFGLANGARSWKKFTLASRHYEELIQFVDRTLGRKHVRFAMVLDQYGRLLFDEWEDGVERNPVDLVKAHDLLVEALEIRTRVLGNEHRQVASSNYWLARVKVAQGEHAEAARLYRESLDARIAIYDSDSSVLRSTRKRLAKTLEASEQFTAAEAVALELVKIQRASVGNSKRVGLLGSFELLLGRILMKQAETDKDRKQAHDMLETAKTHLLTEKIRFPNSLSDVEKLLKKEE